MARPRGAPDRSRPLSDFDALHKLGKYEIQKKLGAGGMGAVYLALDTGLRRSVALKVLPKDKASNPTLVKRFKAEAQSAANLRHDNIVMVYDAGEADGFLYIALEYVEGTDVANLVQKRGVMPVKRTLDVVRQVAQALQHASDQGIVHRDIKPGNILIRRDGVVKLADLGLARAVDDHIDTSITRAGTTVGTVDYMSPEQARDSKAADVRSDLYSLGCTWYYMLTGEPPFPDGSMTNKLRNHAEVSLPDPRAKNPAVTEAAFAVMRRMTEKDPGSRYQTPAELIADLEAAALAGDIVSEAILGELESSPRPPTSGRSTRIVVDTEDGAPAIDPPPRKRKPLPATEPSDDGWKPARERPERESFELSRAVKFYGAVALLVVGVIGGLGMLVKNWSNTLDTVPTGTGANPYADVEGRGGAGSGGPPGASGGPTIDGQAAAAAAGSAQMPQGTASQGPTNVVITGTADAPPTTTITGNAAAAQGTTVAASGSSGNAAPTSGANTTGSGSTSSPDTRATAANVTGSTATGNAGSATSAASEARRKQEEALLPSWSTEPPPAAATPGFARFTVGPGPAGGGRFGTLNAALAQVPSAGAMITLEGSGPFPLYPVVIADKSRIVIRAGDSAGSTNGPQIMLLPSTDGATTDILDVGQTALELERIRLVHQASASGPGVGGALLHIRAGDLSLRDCSITAVGKDPLTAVRLSGQARSSPGASGGRVLIERSVICGSHLAALLVENPQVDVVVRRSLIWSEAAPALRLGGNPAGASPRTLRLVSTTVCSDTAAVQFEGDPGRPAPTSLEWINSLAAAPGGAATPVLCRLLGWNSAQQGQSLGKTLTWKSIDTLYLGWRSLVRLEPDAAAAGIDVAQWQQAWNDRSATREQFQEVAWPVAATGDVLRGRFDRLAPETVPQKYVATSEGGWPGCPLADLALAGLATGGSSQVSRPKLPPGLLGGPVVGEPIRIDANKEDLGRVLAGKKLQNGAQIVVTGSGARTSSPVVIRNVWVHLSFEQTESAPLVISPRQADSARSGDPGARHDALISVINGGLEITGAVFAPPTTDRSLPRYFVEATDSDLALRNCRIQGPMTGTTRNKGLIRWSRDDGRPPTRPFAGTYAAYAALDNVYLFGAGTLIEADLRQRALFVRDSVLVARDNALTIDLSGADSQIGGAVDLESSTLSAAGNVFDIAAAELTAPAESPLSIFVDRCVFAPPLRAGPNVHPTLLAFKGPLLEKQQLAWWENRSGYAPDITSLLREHSEKVQPQDFQRTWVTRWGGPRVLDPLTGPQGVVLLHELPQKAEDRSKLEPEDFTLHSGSKAATWDGGTKPIGAPLASLRVPGLRAPNPSVASPATKGAKQPPKAAPAANKPSF